MLSDIWLDGRHGLRLLARSPGFAAAAILTLGLGLGTTTAIVSVVDAVFVRSLPFPEPDRLVMVWETDRDTATTHEPASFPDYIDFAQRSRTVDRFAALVATDANLAPDRGEPLRIPMVVATSELLPLLGVSATFGRLYTADEARPGGGDVVVVSDRLAERVFGDAAAAIGRTVRIDDITRNVVGVVPVDADVGLLQVLSAADYGRGFADRDARTRVDVWAPLQADSGQLPRDTHPLLTIGRLAPGTSVAMAQRELGDVAAELEKTYPSNRARGVNVEPLGTVVLGPIRPAMLLLTAAVTLVLLIACVNVVNLLLARGTSRVREVAVRSALGAATRRIARQFAIENAVLTTISAALAIAVAWFVLRGLVSAAPADVPRLSTVSIDGRVLGITIAISVVVGVLFGLVPVLQTRRVDLQAALTAEETRGATAGNAGWPRRLLVVAEVAFAVVLMVGAGLLIKSFWRILQVDPGFHTSGVLKAEFQLPPSRYPVDFRRWPDFQEMHRFNLALLARVAALPGVESVAIAGNHPLDAGFTNSFEIVGREAESRRYPEISIRRVSPGYFRTVRVPLLRGRLLTDADTTRAAPVVLLNDTAANRFFAGRDPIGHQIAFWGARRTIVGVLANERIFGVTKAPPIAVYAPLAQAPSATGAEALLVRTNRDPAALASAVHGAIREMDPGLAIFGLEPLEDTLVSSVGRQRFLVLLSGVLACFALLLAAIGIYGVLSFTVAQRRREIGVRVALGATAARVTALVVRQGVALAGIGLLVGIVLGSLFARTLSGLLFGVSATDVTVFAAVTVTLGGIAALSTWVPARRAARIDPITALKEQ